MTAREGGRPLGAPLRNRTRALVTEGHKGGTAVKSPADRRSPDRHDDLRPKHLHVWRLLLALPIVALVPVPLYARATPELLGFPFFYAYQLLWVPITALLTAFVYWRERDLRDGAEVPR
jgi:Protein of unknown function (DUF3311)